MKSPKEKRPLRILLADDHEIIRLGVAATLRDQLECEICAEASDGRLALKLVESARPDVAIVDLGLPGLNGFDLADQIHRRFSATEVVVLSGDDSSGMARRALEAGARAYILKVDAVRHLAGAVQAAAEHRFYITRHTQSILSPGGSPLESGTTPTAFKALTSREREVMQLLAEGKSNKEAAHLLGLSVKTIETHRAATMRKLKLPRPSDLVRYAIRHKLITE